MDFVALFDRTPAPLAGRLRSGGRLSQVLRPVVNSLLPRDVREITVRSGSAEGLRMVIDPQREKFYWTGAYEPAVQSALKETLQPGMCFWDVGAHAGFFSLIAARLVGPTGEVRSFEPLVVNRSRLDANAKLNGFAHVFTHGVALGAEESEVEFRRDPSTFKGSLARPHESAQSEKVVVRQTTIDALSDTLAVPDVIKIDAEGAELDVVRGALRLLLGRRPVLIVEIHGPGREAALRAAAPGLVARRLDGCHLLMTSTG